ncbi:MAG: 3-keto-5-aminohexanoate cleavage protein [Acidimicrobiales bacterium]|nr:3-keto-5-aminohexanoate cleavage protein [Acidimicrobiales bacterium]
MSTPVIVEVAVNGGTAKTHNPAVPIEPAEISADALACIDAGAAIIHTHSDRPRIHGEAAAERYAEAYRPIFDVVPDAICYPTLAFDPENQPEAKFGHQRFLARAGLIRQGLLDAGSVNLGSIADDGLPSNRSFLYSNGPADTRLSIAICHEEGLGPSIAIFEPGYLRVVLAAHDAGALPAGAFVKFYFTAGNPYGGGTPTFGVPPTEAGLDFYLSMLGDRDLPWASAVLGGGIFDTPIARRTIEKGGHLRVGLEDHPDAASNLDQVNQARLISDEMGRALATPSEAAAILQLPT